MSLLTPAALFLAALLPVIVLLYLLKLRRTEHIVPSTYLWRQMVRDVEANAPWQRLKFNILMVLQLLFLALLILALARPATPARGISSRAAIFIIDNSASMAATDVMPTRLEAAKAQARRLVNNMPDGANLTVISTGGRARVAVSQTTDPRQVHQVIDELTINVGANDLAVALQLASAIAARQLDAEIILLSDGNASLPGRISLQGRLNYLPIGLRDDNQAVSLLNLEDGPGGLSAFAQVANYGETQARRRIAFFADGALVDTFDLELDPGDQESVIAGGIVSGTSVLEARLLTDENTIDYLSLDDSAHAIYRPAKPISITLVSPGNLFLETALALMPATQITRINPSSDLNLPPADLTILDSVSLPPTITLPVGSLLYFGPLSGTETFNITGQLINPRPIQASSDEPLLRFISLDTISILNSAQIALPDWARPVIFAEDLSVASREQYPLLFIGEPGGRKTAVLAFDLRRSDLPLQVAFPLLFANLVDWLAPGRSGPLPQTVSPGEVITIAMPPEISVEQISVTRPDGSSVILPVEDSQVTIAESGQLGVYGVEGVGLPLLYTVNLFSPLESSIRRLDALAVDGVENAGENGLQTVANHEWWRVLAVIALLLLLVEWLVYHRPALSRLTRQFGKPS